MTTTITKECFCGATFEAEKKPFELPGRECPACIEQRKQQEAEIEQERRDKNREKFRAKVAEKTPHRFTLTDTKDPRFNLALWTQAAAWKPTAEKPWLGLVGDPGKCKSRCAFLRMDQLAEEDAAIGERTFDFAIITGMDFNRLAVERFSKEKIGQEKASDIASKALRAARKADVLVFDELGKVKSTPGTIDELFSLLDYRHANNLPTIWTSNADPEEFCAAWPSEYAKPGCGRILEASTILKA